MRVQASGNLTIELIRAHRFEVACIEHQRHYDLHGRGCDKLDPALPRHDRVELSPEALASDPWASDAVRVQPSALPALPVERDHDAVELADEPEPISPVVGSPGLAGLGAAWVVPGTLLDIVA